MKLRKGFGKININGQTFLFNWAKSLEGLKLVMYCKNDSKIEIPHSVWLGFNNSAEYLRRQNGVWHGKHKKGPEFGGFGKREARELYFKFLQFKELQRWTKKFAESMVNDWIKNEQRWVGPNFSWEKFPDMVAGLARAYYHLEFSNARNAAKDILIEAETRKVVQKILKK